MAYQDRDAVLVGLECAVEAKHKDDCQQEDGEQESVVGSHWDLHAWISPFRSSSLTCSLCDMGLLSEPYARWYLAMISALSRSSISDWRAVISWSNMIRPYAALRM
jgi:hypothetical protein